MPRDLLLNREWLVTNGLGGYASGTVSGAVTRQYHGLLVSALPAPLGRVVMWSHLSELIRFSNNEIISLGAEERAGGQLDLHAAEYLHEFSVEDGLPVWTYCVRDLVIEKRILMPYRQNTVYVHYQISGGQKPPRLELKPAFHFRHHEDRVDVPLAEPYKMNAVKAHYEVVSATSKLPPLRMRLYSQSSGFVVAPSKIHQVIYRQEQARGNAYEGELWSPGSFQVDLSEEGTATLIASTEPLEIMDVLSPNEALTEERKRRARLLENAEANAREGVAAELVFASDQYVITPVGRTTDVTRAHAAGDEVRTVIAGYHWFTDWGRDTMISLEGLTLVTRRYFEAGYILRTSADYIRDGLIPNMFPDGQNEGLYHTADATLWFFHALGRYLRASKDRVTLQLLWPVLVDIVDHHLNGTKFNIRVDADDGLLTQGKEGYALTWMDAKMGDWIVTPRRGKAVEINALWFNALKFLEEWSEELGNASAAQNYRELGRRVYESFNKRFWYEEGGYLYDVVDPEGGGESDAACRPNQLFAISLDHPVLDEGRWKSVLTVVENELLTPVGLRSLSPKHPDYKSIYSGDLKARDGAYHQGTVWAWLIGPFIDAWLKINPQDNTAAREYLRRFPEHMNESGIGTISEVFDAREPHSAGGCIAQAWSVAELLRCWVKTAGAPVETSAS